MVHVSALFNDAVVEEKPKVHQGKSDRVTVATVGGRNRVGEEV